MHDPGFIGRIRVSPPLNEDERDFLFGLAESGRTLRSTPTGRGNSGVPFARLAWRACLDGCCLSWDPDHEATKWMLPSLAFLIDHLFRPGAKGEGRHQFEEFTFDHVLTGVVVGQGHHDVDTTLVEVTDNVVSVRQIPTPCEEQSPRPAQEKPTQAPAKRAGPRPPNVIEFRPRRA